MRPPLDPHSQTARDNFLKLGVPISSIPAAEDKETWRVDKDSGDPTQLEHMDCFLEDCQLAFNTGPCDETLIDRRLPSILYGVFAKMKRAHLRTEDSDTPTADRRPHLYGQQRLLANVVHEGKAEHVRSAVDYTLVYGRCNRMAANLVILKDNSLDMPGKTWGSSHGDRDDPTAEEEPRRQHGDLWIAMNGTFCTLALEYSALKLSWDTGKSQIIALLEKICKQAIDLVTKN